MFLEKELLSKLDDIQRQFNRIGELLTYEEVLLDKKLFLSLQYKSQMLQPIVDSFKEFLVLQKTIEDIEEMIVCAGLNDKNYLESELKQAISQLSGICKELRVLLNKHNASIQNIIVQIISISKCGLEEEFLNILRDGYCNYCKSHYFDYKYSVQDSEVKLEISGYNVQEVFGKEIGNHVAEKNSKEIKCQVFIYDNITEEIIDDTDIVIATCRASGAGGQHINTTDSSIKATHTKTGIVSVCQDQRSQHLNKIKAVGNLKEKVKLFYNNKYKEQLDCIKRTQYDTMKKGTIVKRYDLTNGIILKSDKNKIDLSKFIQGSIL